MTNSDNTVLVVGGTGFIARWTIVQLLRQGYTVRTTVRDLSREQTLRQALSEGCEDLSRLSFVQADLLSDSGWNEAMRGCTYVIHPASPLGHADADVMVATARDGALRVLRHAADAGVKRVVMTSAANTSMLQTYQDAGTTDETLWTNPEWPNIDPYRKSKTLAELAAWEFIDNSGSELTLTTILPGAVFGPILGTDNVGTPMVIGRVVRGDMPRVPKSGLEVVDVRDVAAAHILAMTSDVAANQRYLVTGDILLLSDIAKHLHKVLGDSAPKLSYKAVPNFLMRRMAKKRPEIRPVVASLGRRNWHTTAKAERELGWTRRSGLDCAVDCARSLIDHGVV